MHDAASSRGEAVAERQGQEATLLHSSSRGQEEQPRGHNEANRSAVIIVSDSLLCLFGGGTGGSNRDPKGLGNQAKHAKEEAHLQRQQ